VSLRALDPPSITASPRRRELAGTRLGTVRRIGRLALWVGLGWAGVTPLAAQADSLAQLARTRYREAMSAYRAGDLTTARGRMLEARTAWPTQWRYTYDVALLAARAGDPDAAAGWIDSLAALGAGPDLRSDPDLAPVASAPAVEAALARLARNRQPMAVSRPRFELTEADLFPEGLDVDSVTGTFYLASIRHRKVVSVSPGGVVRDFVAAPSAPLDAVMGVRVDPRRRRLWVTSRALPLMAGYREADGRRAGIAVFDLATGSLLAADTLPDDGPHTLGDLIVADDGVAYLTDSESPIVYRARLEPDRLAVEPFVTSPLFRSLQGPALDPAGRTLFVADYSHGLLAIDLGSRHVRLIDPPVQGTTLGVDGLTWWNGGLIGIQNGMSPARVVFFELDRNRTRVTRIVLLDRHLPEADEPTIGTRLGRRFFYVANSQWPDYEDDGRLKAGASLRPPLILELTLPAAR
jgi:sugar lactone lactonase YvrE